MIFNPTRDGELAAELRGIRDSGGVPVMLLMRDGEPVHVGLSGDALVTLPPDRVSFDATVGFRITSTQSDL